MKYCVHFMPNRLAATKCPVSWSMTEISRAARKISQPITSNNVRSSLRSGRPGDLPRPRARPLIDREHVINRGHPGTRRVVFRDYASHRVNDPRERDPSRQAIAHADLISAVVDGRGGAAEPGGLPGQRDGGERVLVERLERPRRGRR